MILELDIGNTRIKWRFDCGAGKFTKIGVAADIAALVAELSLAEAPQFIRLCSVRNPQAIRELAQWARAEFGQEVHIAKVSQNCGGVSNQYTDPSKLGVDRWMAMLAAFAKAKGACMIIDCGTALTIDVLNKEGKHLGGFILPGLAMMQQSLQANTGLRLAAQPPANSTELGNSTDEAVCNGALAAAVALIERTMAACLEEGQAIRVYFTGGDAAILAEYSHIDGGEVIPGLVLDGLAVACPFLVQDN